MKYLTQLCGIGMIVLAGCGTGNKKARPQTDQAPVEVPPTALPTDAVPSAGTETNIAVTTTSEKSPDIETTATTLAPRPELPVGVIVRLPVDDQGIEDITRIEMRLDRGTNVATDKSTTITAWEAAEVVDNVKPHDEMDADSSTASWFYYPVGYGVWPWAGPWYGSGYGYRFWPSYGYYGHNYYYNTFPHYYNHWGYNYYYYPRPWGWW